MSVGPREMRGKQVFLCYANQLKHSCSKNDTGGGGEIDMYFCNAITNI